jgi:hypothetical protein
VTVPVSAHDVLTGTLTSAGGSIELASWDVVVLVEEGEHR